MSLGIIPFILLIFILLLIVGVKYKRRIVLYVAAGIVLIAGVVWILGNTLFYYNEDMISVQRTQQEHEKFSIQIKNHEIKYLYHSLWFSCKYSIKDLLEVVQEQYENTYFDEELNQIVIVYENELFTICRMEDIFDDTVEQDFSWLKKYEYILSSNIVSFSEDLSMMESDYIDIPFPGGVLNGSCCQEERNVPITCDFEHLKIYYEDFTNVEIGENTIEIMLEIYKCTITVEGTNAYFELEKC